MLYINDVFIHTIINMADNDAIPFLCNYTVFICSKICADELTINMFIFLTFGVAVWLNKNVPALSHYST